MSKTADAAAPVAMLTVFTFSRHRRVWAFTRMALARPLLRGIPGLRFRKLMGTGRGIGFTRSPDWNRYALLTVWEDEQRAREFLDSSRFMNLYRDRADRCSTLLLRTIRAHGKWNGKNPFLPAEEEKIHPDRADRVCALTRATIRPGRLRSFWRMVEPVGIELAGAEGLLGSIGIGELPFIRQATFSIWESEEKMRAFAYSAGLHKTVVRRTREEGWYDEDLFARFRIIEEIGTFP